MILVNVDRRSRVGNDVAGRGRDAVRMLLRANHRANLKRRIQINLFPQVAMSKNNRTVRAGFWAVFAISLFVPTRSAWTQTTNLDVPRPQEPVLRPASGEGLAAIQQFKFSDKLQCQLYAAEPQVANIVAFYRDYQDRMFVCETFRQNTNTGVEDNRSHPEWMDDELQARTVQDRIAYVLKHVPNAAQRYTEHDDRIRLLRDRDADGVADQDSVFASGFNRLEMGTGADVLSYRNSVYYTCIPDLFKLVDTDQDDVSDQRESLHSGFGVRFAFRGHDMHGLVVGPDGRLYFSIGDRGYNVNPEVFDPASGAVFRCELDGSGLEVVAIGLRNPQNLAFDDFGNLFTGDNNSDSGDRARWVFVVPGGDSGWRMYYQYLPDRGPFNREKIWHPFHSETPAYVIPPIANFSDGPSGLEYYPGTGFGDEFRGRFFLCDFRGTAVNSGVRSFRNRAQGAFFELVDDDQTIWGILPTDLQFASDGKLYVSDWVDGWVGENKGRLYAFSDPQYSQSDVVREVADLLRSGLAEVDLARLCELLSHADRRIRQEAQFEMVRREDFENLKKVVDNGESLLARIHAIWGIEQLVRYQLSAATADANEKQVEKKIDLTEIARLLRHWSTDENAEFRAQVAKAIGETRSPCEDTLLGLLRDDHLRVRYHAAMALGQVGNLSALPEIANLLAENNNLDPIVRHGGIMAIRGIIGREPNLIRRGDQVEKLRFLTSHGSPAVRLATVVAIRKLLNSPGKPEQTNNDGDATMVLGEALRDQDPVVALEAARAIYDLPVPSLLPKLAQINLFANPNWASLPSHLQEAWQSRIIQAIIRLGDQESAVQLAKYAVDERVILSQRVAALRGLMQWTTPPNNDPLNHDWRPVDPSHRSLDAAQTAVYQVFTELATSPEPLPTLAIEAIGTLQLTGLVGYLRSDVLRSSADVDDRVQSLQSLAKLNDTELGAIVGKLRSQFESAKGSVPDELAVVAAEWLATSDPSAGFGWLRQIFEDPKASLTSRQQAIRSVGRLQSVDSASWLIEVMGNVTTKIPPELRLDVVEAIATRSEETLQAASTKYFQTLNSATDLSAEFVDSLAGGNATRGQLVFETKMAVSCVRCHRVQGGEVAVGPNLSDVGLKRTRQQILDSIVQPNKEISEGFGQIKVQTSEGLIVTGLLVSENEGELKLLDAEGKLNVIPLENVEARQPGLSSMPSDLIKSLSRSELRDLVEYLANQKKPAGPGSLQHGN